MLLSMSLSRIPRLLVCVIVLHQWSSVVKSQCVSPPTITEKLQTEIKFETDYHLLECAASGDPQPKFSWRARNTTKPLVLNKSSQTLNISKTDGEGIYTCLATNDCGTALQEFHVIIPRLNGFDARSPRRERTTEGSSAVLTCTPPAGSPSPELSWTIDELEKEPYLVVLDNRVNQDTKTGDLIFANVLPSDQSYFYRCNAENSGRGVKFSDLNELIVEGRDSSSIVNHGPTIAVRPSEHVEGLRGEKLRLECIATGRPTPNVTWSRIRDPIGSQVRHDSYGLALVFDELDFSDAGIYRCQAEIEERGSAFYNVTLTVKSAPYWPEDWDPNVRIGPGESNVIQCPAGGVPNATITWLSNGDKIQNNERVRVEEDMVVITNAMVEDTRVLQCIAENKYGQNFINVNLNTQPIPTEYVTAVTPGTSDPIASTEGQLRINVRMKRQEHNNTGTTPIPTTKKTTASQGPTLPTTTKTTTTASPITGTEATNTTKINSMATAAPSTGTEATNTTKINSMATAAPSTDNEATNTTKINSMTTAAPSTDKEATNTTKINSMTTAAPSTDKEATNTTKINSMTTAAPSTAQREIQHTKSQSTATTAPPTVIAITQPKPPVQTKQKKEQPMPTVKTTPNKDDKDNNTPNKGTSEETTGDENTLLIIIIAVIALGIFVVVILVYVYRSQKSKSGSFKPSVVDSTDNSPADEEGNVGLVPVPFQDQHIDKSSTIVEINSTKENNGITKAVDDDAEKAKSPDASGDQSDESSPDGEKDKADIASTQGPDAMETKTDKEGDAGADTKTNATAEGNDKPSEPEVVDKPHVSEVVDKPPESEVVDKPPESEVVDKPPESENADKLSTSGQDLKQSSDSASGEKDDSQVKHDQATTKPSDSDLAAKAETENKNPETSSNDVETKL